MIDFSFRLHLFDIDDHTAFINNGNGQWQQGISHPHTVPVYPRKDKHHPLILRHDLPKHQPMLTGLWRRSDLRANPVHANGEVTPRKNQLRLRWKGEKATERRQTDKAVNCFHYVFIKIAQDRCVDRSEETDTDQPAMAGASSLTGIRRHREGSSPSSVHGPTAHRISRSVGKPTLAVIRRTCRFLPSLIANRIHAVGIVAR